MQTDDFYVYFKKTVGKRINYESKNPRILKLLQNNPKSTHYKDKQNLVIKRGGILNVVWPWDRVRKKCK